MKIAVGLLFVFLSVFAYSQDSVPEHPFVKLMNGKMIHGKNVVFDERIFAASTVSIDTLVFKSREIQFFKNNDGALYGRFGGLTPSIYDKNNFYFFRKVTYKTNSGASGFGRQNTSSTTVVENYAYSVGLDGPKDIKLKNIIKDIKNDKAADEWIQKAIGYRNSARVCFGLGLFSLFLIPVAGNSSNDGLLVLSGLSSLGLGLASVLFSLEKNGAASKAMETHTGFKPY